MNSKLLFVCLGNICRSAAAEGVAKHFLDTANNSDVFVDSAGTYGGHAGNRADSRMRKAALKRGYDLLSISRKIVKADLDDFDDIVTMDNSNYDNVVTLSTSKNRHKIHKMVDFCKNHNIEFVPDPYYGGEDGFELVLDILEDGCRNLLDMITAEPLKK